MDKKGKSKRPVRPLAPVLHIFCEGKKTEPYYLLHYLNLQGYGTPHERIVIADRKTNTPIQLVEEAIRRQKEESYAPCDRVWVVYDRESEVAYDSDRHNNAWQKAEGKNIGIAFSNVCFEVWLLLHYQVTAGRAYMSCDDLEKNSQLKTYLPKYAKGDKIPFTKEQIANARERAKKMNAVTIDGANKEWTHPYQWNPYTNVYELLDEIDKILQENPR